MSLQIATAEAGDLDGIHELMPGAFKGVNMTLVTACRSGLMVGAGSIEMVPRRGSIGHLRINLATTGERRSETRNALVEHLCAIGQTWGAAGVILGTLGELEGRAAERKRALGFIPRREREIWGIDRDDLQRTLDGLRTDQPGGSVRAAVRKDLEGLRGLGTRGNGLAAARKVIGTTSGSCLLLQGPSAVEEPLGMLLIQEQSDQALLRTFWKEDAESMETGTFLLDRSLALLGLHEVTRFMARGPIGANRSFDVRLLEKLGGTCLKRQAWWTKTFSETRTTA